MAEKTTFIVDCPRCRAKVAAEEAGSAERRYFDEENHEPFAERLLIGKCPACGTLLAAHSTQTHFADIDSEYDIWSNALRVYPKPPKGFSSYRIPKSVSTSLEQAEIALSGGGHIAACVMFGRALEAVCRDKLFTPEEKKAAKDGTSTKRLMLADGIKQLRGKNIIDDRLYDWSQQLHAFRNVAAHPDDDVSISREDADDLQAFAYAIIEYIYDLTERYEEFKERQESKRKLRHK
jgi:hypothetical protein